MSNDYFGERVGALGDIKGDGADDLFVTTGLSSTSIVDSLFYGASGGRVDNQVDAVVDARCYGDTSAAGDSTATGLPISSLGDAVEWMYFSAMGLP